MIEFLLNRSKAVIRDSMEFIGAIFEGPPNEERQEMKVNPYQIGRQRESFWD